MAATTTTAVAIRDPTIAAIEAYPMALEEVRYKTATFRIMYRVTHQVVPSVLLTSNQKLHFCIGSIY